MSDNDGNVDMLWNSYSWSLFNYHLMTLNFLRTGQVLEAPAGTSSKSIYIQCYTATISNKNEVKEI